MTQQAPPGPLDWAERISTSATDGSLLAQMVELITTEGGERADLVFGLVLIAMVVGAGMWIGWELAKVTGQLVRNIVRAAKGKKVQESRFARPLHNAGEDGGLYK